MTNGILLALLPIAYFGEPSLVQLTAHVINNSFNVRHCLYFADGGNEVASHYVLESTSALGLPLVITSLDATPADYLSCQGYILTSNNLTRLEDLFLHRKYKLKLAPHSRVLIFEGETKGLTDYERLDGNAFGNDIFIMRGFTGEVFSLRNNNAFDFHRRDYYATPKWKPKFRDNSTFGVSLFNCPPFVYYSEERGVFDGLEVAILKEIGKSWPLEYHVHTGKSMTLWRKIFSDLYEGKSDLALCSQWMFGVSRMNLDMSFPYTQECITFLVPKPRLLPPSTYVFQPITLHIWLCIIATSFLTALILWSFSRALPNAQNLPQRNFSRSLLDVTRIFSLGSVDFPPPSTNTLRLILTTWCIYSLILTTGYSAGFSTCLTYPKQTRPINDLEDMVDQNIIWGTTGTDALEPFENSTNYIHRYLYGVFLNNVDLKEANRRMREDNNFAVFVTTLLGGHITNTRFLDEYSRTHLKLLSDCAQVYLIVFAFPKKSPFREYFDEHMKGFIEHGFILHWFRKIDRRYGKPKQLFSFYNSYSEELLAVRPLNWERLQGAFYLLGVGLTAAVLMFVYEVQFVSR